MKALLDRVATYLGENVHQGRVVNGGDIAQASIIETNSGKKLFFKTASKKSMFPREANGLRELSKTNTLRVPEVIYVDNDCLVLEWIDTGRKSKDFFTNFGVELANLHKCTSTEYGFFEDNFIGSSPQYNLPSSEEKNNWVKFFWNKRLMKQYEITEGRGLNTSKLTKGFALLENKIEEIFNGHTPVSSLLHGDLWGGNYIVSSTAEPILVDPAVYYGDRESDIAMTRLFGGFAPEFYASYNEVYPFEDGYEDRVDLYSLYHVLNHLNLFGRSYLTQAERLVWNYL